MNNQLNLRVIIALMFPACCYALSWAGAWPEVVLFHCLIGLVFAPWTISAQKTSAKTRGFKMIKTTKDIDCGI